jgi:hypothetical protein
MWSNSTLICRLTGEATAHLTPSLALAGRDACEDSTVAPIIVGEAVAGSSAVPAAHEIAE